MAVLFVSVLLALMKHVAGMREPPQAPSMLEREVTLWEEDPCAQFGAKKKKWWQSNICQCPEDLSLPRNMFPAAAPVFALGFGPAAMV